MRNTARHFKDKYGFSETQVRLWFEDDLKNEFSQRADGGRVTFRTNPYNQTPTQYRNTLFFNDDCD